jgi:hypothetical protein
MLALFGPNPSRFHQYRGDTLSCRSCGQGVMYFASCAANQGTYPSLLGQIYVSMVPDVVT